MTPPFLPLQRAKRCWVLLLLGALISAELVTMVVAAVDAEEECINPNKVRLVTQEELAMYVPHYNSSSIIVCAH
jgi:CMP-2-keto-3-deoxyoctulosonic acid synthetase